MPELKGMPWDEALWEALKASVTPMPPFVRKKALLKIIQVSEENARSRSSAHVETADLLKAVNVSVPAHVRQMCLESLAEQGVAIDQGKPL